MGIEKTYATILALLMFSGIVSIAFSLQPGVVTISNTGHIIAYVMAKSGSPADIQNAVNTMISAGGGTVYIPEGDWVCNQSAGGAVKIDLTKLPSNAWLNIIGSYTNVTAQTNYNYSMAMPATILRSKTVGYGNLIFPYATFCVEGAANKHIRFSGLSILGTSDDNGANGNEAIWLKAVDGFRIDHCYIDSHTEGDIVVWGSKGVIDHVGINQTYSLYANDHNAESIWGIGIEVFGDSHSSFDPNGRNWVMNLSDVVGRYDWQYAPMYVNDPQYGGNLTPTLKTVPYTAGPVYIENCAFSDCRHAIASAQYAYYVARYNFFIESRQGYNYTDVVNMQYVDIHGSGSVSGRGAEVYNNTFLKGLSIDYRGGGGAVFNNTIMNYFEGVVIDSEEEDYTKEQHTSDLWLWGNTFVNVSTQFQIYDNMTLNRDYFLTQRPNYEPYVYPHPLTLLERP
jgi:hypothetical protein